MEIETQGQRLRTPQELNLVRGTLAKKALKFRFHRSKGQFIIQNDRQWILRMFYVLKLHRCFAGEADDTIKDLIAEISSCSMDSVVAIIDSDDYNIQDNRINNENLDNRIDFDDCALKAELKMLVMCHWRPPKTIIQEMAERHGLEYFGREHRVLYLPPYHPEYNGIEMAWGRIKHYVGQNPPYNIDILLNQTLPTALQLFEPETASKIIEHVQKLIEVDANREIDLEEEELRMEEGEDYE